MSYELIKMLHMTMALLLGAVFLLRGGLLLAGSTWQQKTPIRILPHIISAVLIVAGIMLTKAMGGVPSWVWLKFGLLFVFLILSGITFKRITGTLKQSVWLLAALLAYTAAMVVAFTKTIPGFV
jgi:uncharacterized membrane protein SirB2